MREITGAAAPLDLLFMNRQGLLGEVVVRGHLGPCQHRLMKGTSCLTNKMDERKPVDIVYTDFSKVYDTFSASIICVSALFAG